jgi:hypothetical protein
VDLGLWTLSPSSCYVLVFPRVRSPCFRACVCVCVAMLHHSNNDNKSNNDDDAMEGVVPHVASDDDESTEDDEATDSEPEAAAVAQPVATTVRPPKMRIKLKLPKHLLASSHAPAAAVDGGNSSSSSSRSSRSHSSPPAPSTPPCAPRPSPPTTTVRTTSPPTTSPPTTTTTTTTAATTTTTAATAAATFPTDVTSVTALSNSTKKAKPRVRLLPSLPLAAPPKRPPGNLNSSAKKKSRIRSIQLPLSQPPVDLAVAADHDDGIATTTTASAGNRHHAYSKRRSLHPSTKAVKLPPLVSPGLLLSWQPQQTQSQQTPSNHNNNNNNSPGNSSGSNNNTPASLFDASLRAAGYDSDLPSRTHRGSSTTRTVGDLFDSNVTLTLHFPPLVPTAMFAVPVATTTTTTTRATPAAKDADGDVVMDAEDPPPTTHNNSSNNEDDPEETQVTVADLIAELRGALRPDGPHPPQTFADLCPVSLTVPLPETFVAERLAYVKLVAAREAAIVAHQEDVLEGEASGREETTATIPPIPPLPPAPLLPAAVCQEAGLADQYPLYPPKEASLVAHLDPHAFHLTEGRYFGLTSNHVKDPNFVGPHAPGSTSFAGLATSSSSSTAAFSSTPLTLSSVLFSNAPLVPAAAATPTAAKTTTTPRATPREGILDEGKTPTDPSVGVPSEDHRGHDKKEGRWLNAIGTVAASASSQPLPEVDPTTTFGPETAATASIPTASALALRKFMDESTAADKEEMRRTIMRAAVASRVPGASTHSWVGSNGLQYPDIGKAFAAYAGVKPCERCKANKQGSYHCRLRRKHQEPDYDGGDSSAILLRELEEAALLPFLKDGDTYG